MTVLFLALLLASGSLLVLQRFTSYGNASLVDRLSIPDHRVQPFSTEISKLKVRVARAFKSKPKLKLALEELPEILDMLAVSLSAGDGIFAALARVTPAASGSLANELRRLVLALELGSDLETELADLGRRLPQRQVVEFTGKLGTALRRGAPLAHVLREQAESARAEMRNELLRQVGRNETRMLIPLVFLILPVTILFAIFPSLQLINVEYL